MNCVRPIRVADSVRGYRFVPCGCCVPCKINRTADKTLRLEFELKKWSEAQFITLTYDDEHLPADRGLHKDDLQRFFKRYREHLEKPIKYYAVGEYGDETKRPHYHAIVFGAGTDDVTRQLLANSWSLCNPIKFTDERCKGVGSVTTDSINYVSDYCQKKKYGINGVKEYGDLLPPFSLSSRGLGLDYFVENMEQFINDGYINYRGRKVPIPKYFCDKFEIKKHYFSYEDSAYRTLLIRRKKLKPGDDIDKILLIKSGSQGYDEYQVYFNEFYPNDTQALKELLEVRNNLRKGSI